ncbi:MAG TPA: hypothetical protein PLZ93_13670 [Nocardioides sp.]|uniref:hypothetical protein n=1 Tax=uncultured Nocardioides sp. TaxID=198441 RepID=UPI000ECAEA41|nr:hypothetical protein [uncultured Nocardioides sp.]HCB04003.1 hypothetical protein [Nocardioides sp.]HRD61998.1 hypothetical protein [Nocardioides sp.]HRI96658.1 hypothetical protein [Nocardioides sp.]HRK47113.1 hypothetical protein [Nocardioides sp.]
MTVLEPYSAAADSAASRHEAWQVALDRIELDLIRAERALDTGTGLARLDEWEVPDYYGPIPVSLRPRAEEILARQRQTVRRLSEQLGVNAQHQAFVGGASTHSAPTADVAIYVDVNA